MNNADIKDDQLYSTENRLTSMDDEEWKRHVILEAEKEILKYYEKTILSQMNVPNITSNKISDMPVHRSTAFHSSTEKAFEKKEESIEWLNTFHMTLNKLPYEYKNFIEIKYLSNPQMEKGLVDLEVMETLHIHRNYYYKLKPKALYLFGILYKSI